MSRAVWIAGILPGQKADASIKTESYVAYNATYGILQVSRGARAASAQRYHAGTCFELADKRLERHLRIADKRTHERLRDLVCAEERRIVRAILTRGHSEDVPRRGSLDEYRTVTK